MNTQVAILFPFDLGLELDFGSQETQSLVHEVSAHPLPTLTFGWKHFTEAREESHLYRFGVGLIQINFSMDFDLNGCAEISCRGEKISIGGTPILEWSRTRAESLIERAQEFATHRYDLRLKDSDLFPVFSFAPSQVENADEFIRENYKALYGIVAGEPQFDSLSDFVFQKEPLANFGYYETELILLK